MLSTPGCHNQGEPISQLAGGGGVEVGGGVAGACRQSRPGECCEQQCNRSATAVRQQPLSLPTYIQ